MVNYTQEQLIQALDNASIALRHYRECMAKNYEDYPFGIVAENMAKEILSQFDTSDLARMERQRAIVAHERAKADSLNQ